MKRGFIFLLLFSGYVFVGCDKEHNPFIPAPNQNPVIKSMTADPSTVSPGGSSTVTVDAEDPDGDDLIYSWNATSGTINGSGSTVAWTAPREEGTYTVSVSIYDGKDVFVLQSVEINVSASSSPSNQNPVINSLTANPTTISLGGSSTITVDASDPDGDTLSYSWNVTRPTTSASDGTFNGDGSNVIWTATSAGCCAGTYTMNVTVDDGKGGTISSSVQVTVNP